METTSLSSLSPTILTRHCSLPSTKSHNQIFFPQNHASFRFNPISCTNSDGTSSSNDDGNGMPDSVQKPTASPPGAVGVRFKRRSRRQSRQQKENGAASSRAQFAKAEESSSKKKWEEMSIGEKATELYVGEKGVLFWLNKFAYASIFIMIGAWILFRFVGPALNIYQLDSPPLSPDAIFKGST